MKLKTAKNILAVYLVNHVISGTYLYEEKRRLLNSAGFSLGEGTKVVGPVVCPGKLKTGRNCWLGKNLTIHGNGTVEIGDNCDIAPDVTFLTGGHAIGSPERRAGEGQKYTISVGDGCWIGARATLGRNITIGKGCVVAACACVMKDVPENTLVGGVPARIIRKLDEETYE